MFLVGTNHASNKESHIKKKLPVISSSVNFYAVLEPNESKNSFDFLGDIRSNNAL